MLEKIKEILVEQLNCDADSINEDTSLKMTWVQIPGSL